MRTLLAVLTAAVALAPRSDAAAQSAARSPLPAVTSRDTVIIAAARHYDAGPIHRWLLGQTYRDYWIIPLRVPVLDLQTYAGGLEPIKEGGGKQTSNLRLGASDGTEYVFRPINKAGVNPPDRLRGTVVEALFRDQISAMFPAAALVAAPLVDAAGVLHATPQLAVMPNDERLGRFRERFINQLALIEAYPTKRQDGPGFRGAVDVIDSEELIPLLDSLPTNRVDERAYLAARLTDFLLGDNDRHHGNWKWARFGSGKRVQWVPIARDRDHAFHNYDGMLAKVASRIAPNLTTFDGHFADIAALSHNARTVDRRLLVSLDRTAWDSVASALQRRFTDHVIDSAVSRTPTEYRALRPPLAVKLRQRRDGLREVAGRFYDELARVVDVHATDVTDHAAVTYLDDRRVRVALSASGETYFDRTFESHDTREVRVYLHDGDDSATVRGDAESRIVVRVIGGNGDNALRDSTARQQTRLYDRGRTRGIAYGPDSLRDTLFDRRPWVNDTGAVRPPSVDFGSRVRPIAGFDGGSGLGIVPQIGVSWARSGFGREPYSTFVSVDGAYSFGIDGYRVTLFGDHRLEHSPVHVMATARMSDFEVINFHGIGNQSPREPDDYFHVDQRQWMLQPALAIALGRRESDLTVGPVVQYAVTDGPEARFIAREQPYGVGHFGQAGARMGLRYDARDNASYATRGFLVDATSSVYPALWDVEHPFTTVSASATTFVGLPLPRHPVLAFRGGGRKVWGEAPFHELAFIGGRGTVRGMDAQRYAGDASMYGTAELRVPIASVRYVLPLDVGLLGFGDAGRVYVDGDSPGGWHRVAGGGVWIGILDEGTGLSFTWTSSAEKRFLLGTGLRF